MTKKEKRNMVIQKNFLLSDRTDSIFARKVKEFKNVSDKDLSHAAKAIGALTLSPVYLCSPSYSVIISSFVIKPLVANSEMISSIPSFNAVFLTLIYQYRRSKPTCVRLLFRTAAIGNILSVGKRTIFR